MMDWENLRHLAALASTGSLSAAARQLGVEHATVARRIAALEAATCLRLVDRRGRRLTLTADGEKLAAIAGRMEEEARAVSRVVAGSSQSLSGVVSISAPPALAAATLAGPLAALQRRHPALSLHIVGEARHASLERREADIALRLGRPEQGELTVVRLGEMVFRPWASAAWLASTPPEAWQFIGSGPPMAEAAQQQALEAFAGGRPFSFVSASAEIQLALARAGGGIAMLPDFMTAGEAMTAGDAALVPVPGGPAALRRELWLLVHPDLATSAAVRAVVRCLRDWYAGQRGAAGSR